MELQMSTIKTLDINDFTTRNTGHLYLLPVHFSRQPHSNIFGIFKLRMLVKYVRCMSSEWGS